MKKIFTEAWVRALCKELRRSEKYRHAARNWEADLVLTVDADAAHGGTKQRGAYLNLWRGECREARLATAKDYERSRYVVSAGPETWARLFSGKGDLLSHILRRRLKLKKGSASGLRQHITAARALIEAAGRVSSG